MTTDKPKHFETGLRMAADAINDDELYGLSKQKLMELLESVKRDYILEDTVDEEGSIFMGPTGRHIPALTITFEMTGHKKEPPC
jgi:hypothetical protein